MNPAAPDGAPPRRISACKHICKRRSVPPCLGEALRRGALIKITWFNDFYGSVRTPSHVCFNRAGFSHIFLTGKMKNKSGETGSSNS